jgi:HD-like signal output (HDOD) protein
MSSASKLASSLRIPPRPDTLTQVMQEIGADSPNLGKIGQLIKKDVTLFGAILRLVNSPALGFQDVKTIDRAIMLLGIKRVGQLVQVISLQNTLSAKLKINRFWDTAAEVAEITSTLARQLTGISVDDAYATGMFHDFGIPLMVQAFPDFKELMAEANANPDADLAVMETQLYGFNHYDVGYELGRQWLLPPSINFAIRYQPQLVEVLSDKIAIDDIETVKPLLALLEMAKNISAMYRKYWRSQDQDQAIDIEPLAYEYFDLSLSDYVEMRDNYMQEMAAGR